MTPRTHVIGLDHVQLAMPRGAEQLARRFYADLLGLDEIPKPPQLASRGGLWFSCGELQLHLGVEEPFAAARKAHPALRIVGYQILLDRLDRAGVNIVRDSELPGVERAFVSDPFGNRLELIRWQDSGS